MRHCLASYPSSLSFDNLRSLVLAPLSPTFEQDKPTHVVGEIAETDFRFGTRDTDRAHDEPHQTLLMIEDMLDGQTELGFAGIG